MDTLGFPQLETVDINVDSKANFLWLFLYWMQSLSLPVSPLAYTDDISLSH